MGECAARVGADKALVHRLLYGDRRASRRVALSIEREFGIDVALWDKAPRHPFVVPARRAA